MRNIKIQSLILSLVATATSLYGQNDIDALRYSQLMYGGTARSMGLSNAFGALGADFSATSMNPAGLGLYRKSEMTITPALYMHEVNAVTLDPELKETELRSNFNFSNYGFVWSSEIRGNKNFSNPLHHVNFAIGYNRLANFHSQISVDNDHQIGSILDVYLDELNAGPGTAQSVLGDDYSYTAQLAFNTYLLDTIPGDTMHYFSKVPYGGVRQSEFIETSGASGETVISFGGNLLDRIFFGGTLGIPSIRYKYKSTYTERDVGDSIADFESLRMTEELYAKGTGLNFKFGLIYRPVHFIRVGASIHSPTLFKINEAYSNSTESFHDENSIFGDYTSDSPKGSFTYSLQTPMRIQGSVAYIIGKLGLVSVEYEHLNYSNAKLDSKMYAFDDENESIRSKYTYAGNLRIGTEWRINNYALRGGFAYYSSPFDDKGMEASGDKYSYSVGVGYRQSGYSIDFAYALTSTTEEYYMYSPPYSEMATLDRLSHNALITLGFRY